MKVVVKQRGGAGAVLWAVLFWLQAAVLTLFQPARAYGAAVGHALGVDVKRVGLFLALCFAALALAGCTDNYEWRQKLTVVVETPQGDRSGAAVTEVSVAVGKQPLSGNERAFGVRGEATVVEVAPGKYLFALLSRSGASTTDYLAETVWDGSAIPRNDKFGKEYWGPIYSAIESMQGAREVPTSALPTLVTFTDINDPKTVKEVKPYGLADAFGPGYALKSITLEITGEKVTKGKVEEVLGWLNDINVMENPGWKSLPLESRRAIGGLLSYFPNIKG